MGNPIRLVAVVVIVAAVAVGAWLYLGAGGSEDSDAMVIKLGSNTNDVITGVEYAPAGSGTYSAVALKDGKLNPGLFVDMTIAGGKTQCKYDLRFTMEKGDVAERKAVDLCAATYYHFEPE